MGRTGVAKLPDPPLDPSACSLNLLDTWGRLLSAAREKVWGLNIHVVHENHVYRAARQRLPNEVFLEVLRRLGIRTVVDLRRRGTADGPELCVSAGVCYENAHVRSSALPLPTQILIGVSNFMQHHLEDLASSSPVVPSVNQVEFHPLLVQPGLLQYCRDRGIRVEAWSPLMQGHVVDQPIIRDIADKYRKTPAQVALRWNLQHGVVTIPKSVRRERITENAAIFDFELTAEDMRLLDSLDAGRRFGPDPDNFDF